MTRHDAAPLVLLTRDTPRSLVNEADSHPLAFATASLSVAQIWVPDDVGATRDVDGGNDCCFEQRRGRPRSRGVGPAARIQACRW